MNWRLSWNICLKWKATFENLIFASGQITSWQIAHFLLWAKVLWRCFSSLRNCSLRGCGVYFFLDICYSSKLIVTFQSWVQFARHRARLKTTESLQHNWLWYCQHFAHLQRKSPTIFYLFRRKIRAKGGKWLWEKQGDVFSYFIG